MDLHLRRVVIGSTPVLMASGEIDLATIPDLRNALVKLVGSQPGSVVGVDLDGVSACDDLGLGVLLGTAGRAREIGGDLVLVCTDQRLLARFNQTRLDQAITIVNNIAAIEHAPTTIKP